VITPVLGAKFILTDVDAGDADTVKIPYLTIAAIFLAVAAMIYFARLPEVREGGNGDAPVRAKLSEAWRTPISSGRYRAIPLCRGAGGRRQLRDSLCRTSGAGHSRQGRCELSEAAFARLHDRTLRRRRDDEVGARPASALHLFGRRSVVWRVAVAASGSVPIQAVVLIGFFTIMFPYHFS